MIYLIIYKVYSKDLDRIVIGEGFFDGWPNPPDKSKHREILEKSYKAIVAIDKTSGKIIGFINAVSDGVLSAYIPLVEVLEEYQNQGIGTKLVHMMLKELDYLYMVDLLCDKDLQLFYEKVGMHRSQGMIVRNYNRQSGRDI